MILSDDIKRKLLNGTASRKLNGYLQFRFIKMDKGEILARAELVNNDGDPLFVWGPMRLQEGQSIICDGLELGSTISLE